MLDVRLLLLCAAMSAACSSSTNPKSSRAAQEDPVGAADAATDVPTGPDASDDPAAIDPEGAFAVGTMRIEVAVSAERTLPVQLWYAAKEAPDGTHLERPLAEFEPAGEKRETLRKLAAAAPDKCTNKTMHATDALPLLSKGKKWPLIVFSHCMDCTRFSMFSVAEHLVSLGFVVAAPDHVGGTLYENKGILDNDFLKVREADIRSVLDFVLDDGAKDMPEGLRGQIDPARIGAMGHSYGSVTTGLALQNDPRVQAAVFIAAPPESPLLSGASVQKLKRPALYIEAMEDHSIQLIGNNFIESNYRAHPASAFLLKVSDAGHWSFSDICALTDTFKPGCGMDTRQNPLQGGTFSYLDNAQARGIAREYIGAFFAKHLLGDDARGAYLDKPLPADVVKIEHHD